MDFVVSFDSDIGKFVLIDASTERIVRILKARNYIAAQAEAFGEREIEEFEYAA